MCTYPVQPVCTSLLFILLFIKSQYTVFAHLICFVLFILLHFLHFYMQIAGCIALRIRAFRGNVRDCITPSKQGGQRLNWRAYQCSIMLSDILGIVFHALRNWHISFRGLDVGIAGECCTAITRESSGSIPLWGGASGVVLTEWGGKSSFAQIYTF